jgi:hypothetical protein
MDCVSIIFLIVPDMNEQFFWNCKKKSWEKFKKMLFFKVFNEVLINGILFGYL